VKAYPRCGVDPLVLELVGLGVLLTLFDPSHTHAHTHRYAIQRIDKHSRRRYTAEMIAGETYNDERPAPDHCSESTPPSTTQRNFTATRYTAPEYCCKCRNENSNGDAVKQRSHCGRSRRITVVTCRRPRSNVCERRKRSKKSNTESVLRPSTCCSMLDFETVSHVHTCSTAVDGTLRPSRAVDGRYAP